LRILLNYKIMHLPFFIARRYLFSKKKHNVINIISVVSACAIGIGCLALIIILSVYNGFDSLIASMYENYIPDFVIEPAKGKVLNTDDAALQRVKNIKGIFAYCPVVEENVFLQYSNVQSIATIKGVPDNYSSIKKITSHIADGVFQIKFGELNKAVVGAGLAQRLRLQPSFTDPISLFFPTRTGNISMLMPMESVETLDIHPSGIIQLEQNFDKNSLFIPLDAARELIEYEPNEANKIEIYLSSAPGTGEKKFIKTNKYKTVGSSIKRLIGANAKGTGKKFIVKDRWQQNMMLYKMMRSEKFAVYLILFFVIVVVSVNIFASLSMLIIDKQEDIGTYKAMGAKNKMLRRTFTLQGCLICMSGAVIGLAIGLILCIIQQRFGVVPMPGNFTVSSYPVDIQVADIIVILAGTAVVGFFMSYIPARSIRE
jgi:lipoprotein-releasing system permease protein